MADRLMSGQTTCQHVVQRCQLFPQSHTHTHTQTHTHTPSVIRPRTPSNSWGISPALFRTASPLPPPFSSTLFWPHAYYAGRSKQDRSKNNKILVSRQQRRDKDKQKRTSPTKGPLKSKREREIIGTTDGGGRQRRCFLRQKGGKSIPSVPRWKINPPPPPLHII